ncbi:MAG: Hpt domain-containing protein [Acutalibacteraceae bacterium]
MTLSELYEALGGDYNDVLERLDDPETVEHFLIAFSADPSYSQLMHSLSGNDIQSAFRAAHTLKGVSLSLGLKRLGNVSGAVCENLRAGIRPSDTLLKQLETEYRGVISSINKFQNSK